MALAPDAFGHGCVARLHHFGLLRRGLEWLAGVRNRGVVCGDGCGTGLHAPETGAAGEHLLGVCGGRGCVNTPDRTSGLGRLYGESGWPRDDGFCRSSDRPRLVMVGGAVDRVQATYLQ